jgi:hypothetical protein
VSDIGPNSFAVSLADTNTLLLMPSNTAAFFRIQGLNNL